MHKKNYLDVHPKTSRTRQTPENYISDVKKKVGNAQAHT